MGGESRPGESQPTAYGEANTRLVVAFELEGARPEMREVVVDAGVCRIGSDADNEIVVRDASVAECHCVLSHEDGAWWVTDDKNTRGTWLSGLRITRAQLPWGETSLTLGESRLWLRNIPSGEELPRGPTRFGAIMGRTANMRQMFNTLERVAASDASVLIQGESGTGKEVIAHEIAKHGPRASRPFVVVDCASITPSLIEDELFGHVRGAYTGAEQVRKGAFEAANGGTVMLDEIGELPMSLQPKLLRVLEAGTVRKIGDNRVVPVDVRIIAATNRRLEHEVSRRCFREDLFFRLSVVTIRVPPLREHLDDLCALIRHFLEQEGAADKFDSLFNERVLAQLRGHHWPGNVRELRNYVERALVLAGSGEDHDAGVQSANPVSGPEAPDSRKFGDAVDQDASGPVSSYPPSSVYLSSTPPMGRSTSGFPSVDRPEIIPPGALATGPAVRIDEPYSTAKAKAVAAFERRYCAMLLDWAEGNVSAAARRAGMDRMHLHRLLEKHEIPRRRRKKS